MSLSHFAHRNFSVVCVYVAQNMLIWYGSGGDWWTWTENGIDK